MTREEVIQLALDIGLRAARTYKYRGSLEALTEPERKELEQLLEFANQIIQRDEALLRQALEALESCDGYMEQLELIVYSRDDTGTHGARAKVQSTIAALRERLSEGAEP